MTLDPAWASYLLSCPGVLIPAMTSSSGDASWQIVLLVNATSGTKTITLPDPSERPGGTLGVGKTDATENAVQVVGTVNGVSGYTIADQGESAVFQSTGTEWVTITGQLDRLAHRVNLVLPETKDHRATRARRATLGLKETRAHRATLVPQALQDCKARRTTSCRLSRHRRPTGRRTTSASCRKPSSPRQESAGCTSCPPERSGGRAYTPMQEPQGLAKTFRCTFARTTSPTT